MVGLCDHLEFVEFGRLEPVAMLAPLPPDSRRSSTHPLVGLRLLLFQQLLSAHKYQVLIGPLNRSIIFVLLPGKQDDLRLGPQKYRPLMDWSPRLARFIIKTSNGNNNNNTSLIPILLLRVPPLLSAESNICLTFFLRRLLRALVPR